MKSIVIAKRHKNEFYMGTHISWYRDLLPKIDEVLKYDYVLTDSPGVLRTNTKKLEDIVIKETFDFHSLLKVGDFIEVDEKEYAISKVKHGADGTMYYYVNIEYEDKESKKEADKQIELRKAYLKGREDERRINRELQHEKIFSKDETICENVQVPKTQNAQIAQRIIDSLRGKKSEIRKNTY
ncbi:hypothetical protein J2W97_001266 [Paenibacillus jamilae]|nr:hypothetical protein [Paenibacillus jamilae]